MTLTTKVLRCLFWGVLAVCAVVLAACLGLRYLVLPKVDQWRPQIEHYASQAVGAPVRIGSIAADWSGLNPRLHLSAVQFYDGPDKTQPAVALPSVDAVLAWRSVLRMTPRLLSLRIEGADLTVRRDTSGLLWVAGMSFDPDQVMALRELMPSRPRGIVAEHDYTAEDWPDASPAQRHEMTHLRHFFRTRPDFVAYWVNELPSLAPWLARNVLGCPLLTWTVRTAEQRARAARYADQMIFEGFVPGR